MRDIRAFPWQSYRLATDGRKGEYVAGKRRELAMQLASYADGDGSSIRVSLKRLYAELGWTTRTVDRRLSELEQVGPGLLSRVGLTQERGVAIRRLDVSVLKMPGADSPNSTPGSPDSIPDSPDRTDQVRQIEQPIRQIARPDSPNSGADSPPIGGERPTTRPAAETGTTTDRAVGGWFRKYTATMSVPGRKQIPVLESLAEKHGVDVISRAVELLLDRGLGNALNPWAVFVTGGWIEKAEQERLDRERQASSEVEIEKSVAEQKRAWSVFLESGPVENEGSVLDYIADVGFTPEKISSEKEKLNG